MLYIPNVIKPITKYLIYCYVLNPEAMKFPLFEKRYPFKISFLAWFLKVNKIFTIIYINL